MGLLRLRLRAKLKQTGIKAIALGLTAAAGIASFVALQNTYQALNHSVGDMEQECGTGDFYFRTVAVTEENLAQRLKDLEGLKTEKRYVDDAVLQTENGEELGIRLIGTDGDMIVGQKRVSGNAPKGTQDIDIAYAFKQTSSLEAGQDAVLDMNGRSWDMKISGVFAAPEYMSTFRSVYGWFDDTDFGYGRMELSALWELTGMSGMYNEFVFSVTDKESEDELFEELNDRLGDITYYGCRIKDAPNYRFVSSVVEAVRKLYVVPCIFFVISVLFLYLFLSQLIRQDRREIGLLRGMGFQKSQITGFYIVYALIITIFGGVLGSAAGTGLGFMMVQILLNSVNIPSMNYEVYIPAFAESIIICMAIAAITGLLVSKKIADIQPADSMRSEQPGTVKVGGAARKLTAWTKGMTKSCILMIFRNKRRFILTVVCMVLTTVMMLSSFIFIASKEELMVSSFDERMQYNTEVHLKYFVDVSYLENIEEEGINEKEPVIETGASFRNPENGKSETALLCGIQKDSSLIGVYGAGKEKLEIPEQGIILEEQTAKKLSLKEGDEVEAVYSSAGNQTITTKLTVAGISSQYSMQMQICDIETARTVTGTKNSMNAVVGNVDLDRKQELADKLKEYSTVDYISYKSDKQKKAVESLDPISFCFSILIVAGAFIGFIIIYNVNLINFTDRKNDYLIFRILGNRTGKIGRALFVESLLQFLAGMLLGVPIGTVVGKHYIGTLEIGTVRFPCVISMKIYVLCVGLTFLYVVAGHVTAMYKLKKMNLAEEMKAY